MPVSLAAAPFMLTLEVASTRVAVTSTLATLDATSIVYASVVGLNTAGVQEPTFVIRLERWLSVLQPRFTVRVYVVGVVVHWSVTTTVNTVGVPVPFRATVPVSLAPAPLMLTLEVESTRVAVTSTLATLEATSIVYASVVGLNTAGVQEPTLVIRFARWLSVEHARFTVIVYVVGVVAH